MQYSVPQFVDVEDKIVGPLTLKQFLILLVGALFGFMYWSIFKATAGFFLLMLPTAAIFGFLAFGKFNGRPILKSLPLLIQFFLEPHHRLFKRTGALTSVIKQKSDVREKANSEDELNPFERTSRLHRLAYLLDQKSSEEERLIHQDDA